MKKLSILTLAVLTGCVGVKPPTKTVDLPPMPPGYTAKAVKPKRQVVAAFLPEVWVPEKLYIQQRPTGMYLCWLTNTPQTVLIASTDLTKSPVVWEVLGTHCKSLEGDHWALPITQTNLPQRFFRLMAVPTNSAVFSWDYPLEYASDFTLHSGPNSHSYNSSTNVGGRKLWFVYNLVDTNRYYYVMIPRLTNGYPGELSNEVNFAPGDPPGVDSPPCP